MADERSSCGYPGVQISSADGADLHVACDALAATVLYFRRVGFRVEPKFSLTFGDDGHPADSVPAHGHFDPQSLRLAVHPPSPGVAPWGLPWSRKLAASFVHHEFIHMAVWQILRAERTRLPREWHEFIAYAVQLALMEGQLLRDVLAKAADVRPFASLSEVNEFTYGMNPDVFAVAAYRAYRERGAEKFVRQLLRGEVVPPVFSSPHPILPDSNQR